MKKERRRFTLEFKAEAVKLWESSGRKSTKIAADLGIQPQLLSRWAQELGDQKTNPARCPITQATGSSSDAIQDPATELAQLRKENARLKLEQEILKKTVAFIAEITK
jgi:transposase